METIALKTIARKAHRVQHTVRCPACYRKLCNLSLDGGATPTAVIQESGIKYDLELRCASCKAFVGVTFH